MEKKNQQLSFSVVSFFHYANNLGELTSNYLRDGIKLHLDCLFCNCIRSCFV